MTRAVYICQVGCMAECRHHHACVVYMIDAAHPHPTKRGREQHYAMADDGMMHEWNGAAGKCRIYDPAEEEKGQVELEPMKIEIVRVDPISGSVIV